MIKHWQIVFFAEMINWTIWVLYAGGLLAGLYVMLWMEWLNWVNYYVLYKLKNRMKKNIIVIGSITMSIMTAVVLVNEIGMPYKCGLEIGIWIIGSLVIIPGTWIVLVFMQKLDA